MSSNYKSGSKQEELVIIKWFSYILRKSPMKCFVILLHNHNIIFGIRAFISWTCFIYLCCFIIYLFQEVFAVQKFTWEPIMSPDSSVKHCQWQKHHTENWHWNAVQNISKNMKYSKMQMHGNVCVHQMSVIFILKIKDYFSSNKADVTTYICLFIYNILHNEIHKWLVFRSFIKANGRALTWTVLWTNLCMS